jgi:hypothetical protein
MSFDTVVGVLSLAVGFASVMVGLASAGKPGHKQQAVALLSTLGIAMIAFTAYFLVRAASHDKQVAHVKAAILEAVANRPLTIEQIRDTVALADNAAAYQDILEAVEQLQSDRLLHVSRAYWQDQNARQYYTKMYERY